MPDPIDPQNIVDPKDPVDPPKDDLAEYRNDDGTFSEEKIKKYEEKYSVKINRRKDKQWIEQIRDSKNANGFNYIKEKCRLQQNSTFSKKIYVCPLTYLCFVVKCTK